MAGGWQRARRRGQGTQTGTGVPCRPPSGLTISRAKVIFLTRKSVLTGFPAGPVCLVTNTCPSMRLASATASEGLVMCTPPCRPFLKVPIPLPPARICDLTTTDSSPLSSKCCKGVRVQGSKVRAGFAARDPWLARTGSCAPHLDCVFDVIDRLARCPRRHRDAHLAHQLGALQRQGGSWDECGSARRY